MLRGKRFVVGVIAACLAFVTTGCGEDDPRTKPTEYTTPASSSAPSSPAAPTTDPVADEEAAVIAAYKGFYSTLNALTDFAEPDVRAVMAPFTSGLAMEKAVAVANGFAVNGYMPSGTISFAAIEVVLSSESEASVTECRDTSTETIIERASGREVSHGAPGTYIHADLIEEAGVWKVVDMTVQDNSC